MARADITMLSWAGLGYGFKYVWAPLVDRMPLPVISSAMGQRRSWLLVSQFAVMTAMLGMAWTDPAHYASAMAGFAVLLGFSSATQDIVIDAYRIEVADADFQAFLSSTYIAGYRVAMVVAGAGAFEIATLLGTTESHYVYDAWRWTYTAMAGIMLVGVITTCLVAEPEIRRKAEDHLVSTGDHARFFAVFVLCAALFVAIFVVLGDMTDAAKLALADTGMGGPAARFLVECMRLGSAVGAAVLLGRGLLFMKVASKSVVTNAYIGPFKDFFARYGKHAMALLCLIALYRSSDIIMGAIANVFYVDIGFDKQIIGRISKGFGLVMTIVGSFAGGLLALRYGVMKILFVGAVLSAASNVLFAVLASVEPSITMLTIVIAIDNLSAGVAVSAFVAYLSALTSIQFSATQYALFSSIMLLLPKLLAGYSGGMVDAVGYEAFFIGTAVLGIPVAILVLIVARLAPVEDTQ